MAERHDLQMVRGDTLSFDIQAEGLEGSVTNVTMTARLDGSGTNLFQVTLGDGITATEEGWHVRVPPAATQDAAPTSYRYDVQFVVGDDVYTPLYGTLKLIEDVTEMEE